MTPEMVIMQFFGSNHRMQNNGHDRSRSASIGEGLGKRLCKNPIS
jgi:hypothetical protein